MQQNQTKWFAFKSWNEGSNKTSKTNNIITTKINKNEKGIWSTQNDYGTIKL